MSNVNNHINNHISNEITGSIKHYCNSWSTIGAYFLLFPLGIGLLRSKTPREGINVLLEYPAGIVSLGISGGLFGFSAGIYKYQNEVLPKLPDYTIDVISTITDEMYLYAKVKLDEMYWKYTSK